MSTKTDIELQDIVDNKNDFQDEAYLSAIKELEKRGFKLTKIQYKQKEEIEKNTKIELKSHKLKKELNNEIKITKFTDSFVSFKTKLITPILVFSNILVYFIMILCGVSVFSPTVESLIDWGGNINTLTFSGEQWRLLTNIFLHGGLIHLIINTYALIHIGRFLEAHLQKFTYLLAYISSGILASIASCYFNDYIVSVGASGAIFGMYGFFGALLIFKQVNIQPEVRKKLIKSIGTFIVFNLIYGFTKSGIDNPAHIGGLISGFIIGVVYIGSIKYDLNSITMYTLIISFPLVFTITTPKFNTENLLEAIQIYSQFEKNEKNALWIHSTDFSTLNKDSIDYYYNKIQTDAIELWKKNYILIDYLESENGNIKNLSKQLKKYCNLRTSYCKTMQKYIKDKSKSNLNKLDCTTKKIEELLFKLQENKNIKR
jgi:rhomboid protease GluP